MKRVVCVVFAVLMLPSYVRAEIAQVVPMPSDHSVEVVPDRIDVMEPMLPEEPVHLAIIETYLQGKCVEWVDTALEAGWNPEELPRLMRIMFRESRCIPTACGLTDSPHLRKCRDWGLMQINDYSWKRIIREMGWEIEQMHDPLENLRFARWLYEYSLDRNGDGWQPWKLTNH
jgi:hypothetical protein